MLTALLFVTSGYVICPRIIVVIPNVLTSKDHGQGFLLDFSWHQNGGYKYCHGDERSAKRGTWFILELPHDPLRPFVFAKDIKPEFTIYLFLTLRSPHIHMGSNVPDVAFINVRNLQVRKESVPKT